MAEVGSAFVSLLPSAKGFGKATEKQIGGEIDTAGKKTGSRFGGAMAVGAAAVGGGLGQTVQCVCQAVVWLCHV